MYPTNAAGGPVPTTDPLVIAQRRPVLNSVGYGIVGGVPRGHALKQRRIAQETETHNKFNPAGLARLRAATARALGY